MGSIAYYKRPTIDSTLPYCWIYQFCWVYCLLYGLYSLCFGVSYLYWSELIDSTDSNADSTNSYDSTANSIDWTDSTNDSTDPTNDSTLTVHYSQCLRRSWADVSSPEIIAWGFSTDRVTTTIFVRN